MSLAFLGRLRIDNLPCRMRDGKNCDWLSVAVKRSPAHLSRDLLVPLAVWSMASRLKTIGTEGDEDWAGFFTEASLIRETPSDEW